MSLFAIDLQAAPARAKQAKQQCDGHPTAERVVAEVVKGLERDNGPDVSHGRGRAVDEVGKSGVLCPDEPPDDAKCDRRQHAISGIGMQQAFCPEIESTHSYRCSIVVIQHSPEPRTATNAPCIVSDS